MGTQLKHKSLLSIQDAVDVLANLADLDLNQAVPHSLQNFPDSLVAVREIFGSILHYLRRFYNQGYTYSSDPQITEGIKAIMVLVGEAAKKIDRYIATSENNKMLSVTSLPEYQQLQDFYMSKIARKIDESTLSKWMLELTKLAAYRDLEKKLSPQETLAAKHVLIDFESVKNDTEYELFYLRREDATRFYHPRLIRSIQLVSDFGDYFQKSKAVDEPLKDLILWEDRCYFEAAKTLLSSLKIKIHHYFKESTSFKGRELIQLVNKALMALMLCANRFYLSRQDSHKGCKAYFADFQFYLRAALLSTDYQKLLPYSLQTANRLDHCVLDIVQSLCMGVFEGIQFYQPFSFHLDVLVTEALNHQSDEHQKGALEERSLWNILARDNRALERFLKPHVNTSLSKALSALEANSQYGFDPYSLQDLPSQLYSLYFNENKIVSIQIPSPTTQEFIHKAAVIEEFKAFLRRNRKGSLENKHLVINLQDRTSWREHARCIALESLQQSKEFEESLVVITLAKDTEFYHQKEPYSQDHRADIFIQNLKEILQDDHGGYYFPEFIRQVLFPHFIDGVIKAIHQGFFAGRNMLLREHRLDFMELFYIFLELKLIEIVAPKVFCLMCKDGVDVASTANVSLLVFLRMINQENLTEKDLKILKAILYAPALLFRGRLVLPERFQRMNSMIKCMESLRGQLGEKNFVLMIQDGFGDLYKTPILKAKVLL